MRCRPLFGKEIKEGREAIVECDVTRGEIRIVNPKNPDDPPKQFTFDNVYDSRNSQLEIYEESALPIVRAAIEGYNGTIFCYGQTGTGKTHTMEGKDEPASERGIIPNAFETLFGDIDAVDSTNKNFLVRASFLEIYNENVRDLLGKDQSKTCDLKETPERGVYVKDLTTFVVKSVAEIRKVLEVGKKNRSVGATLMNADSSRSHSIFTVTVETSEVDPGGREEDAHIRVGKLNLVDLAGSERQSKTQATGDRLKEATKINLSLSALGNVISALVDGKSAHIPYRDSKLTRLLQDSLGGNTKTVMIANLGPADYNFDETMSTLRYANRAKNIKNKPKINEDPKDAMLREFQEEIARLKAQLGAGGSAPDGAPRRRRADRQVVERTVYSSDARLERIKDEMRREMEANAAQDMEAEEAEKAQALVNLKARKQMKVLMEEKERTEEERAELEDAFRAQQAEAQAQFEEMRREKDEQRALEEKLAAMQAKVVRGGTNLLDQEQRLLEEARRREEKLAKIAAAEAEQARRIKELEDLNTITGDKYKTIEEEIESKARKIHKLHEAYQRCVVDLKDLDLEFERERENLLDTVRALTRQIKLKNLVLDSYVPGRASQDYGFRVVGRPIRDVAGGSRAARGKSIARATSRGGREARGGRRRGERTSRGGVGGGVRGFRKGARRRENQTRRVCIRRTTRTEGPHRPRGRSTARVPKECRGGNPPRRRGRDPRGGEANATGVSRRETRARRRRRRAAPKSRTESVRDGRLVLPRRERTRAVRHEATLV